MRKRCPLCAEMFASVQEWRAHATGVHDWDPDNEPTWVGDFLFATGLGLVAFLSWGMTGSFGFTRTAASGAALTAWWILGLVALPAMIVVLVVQPLRRFGHRLWGSAWRRAPARRMTRTQREQARRIDSVTSAAIGAAGGLLLIAWAFGAERAILTVISLAVVAGAAFIRAVARRRLLE